MNKEQLINTLDLLGFNKEYDQYDIKDKGWIRFRHKLADQGKEFALIIYNDYSKEIIFSECAEMLIKVGKYLKLQQLQEL